jgi:hypothetical protein
VITVTAPAGDPQHEVQLRGGWIDQAFVKHTTC